jgi:hypothetical protein
MTQMLLAFLLCMNLTAAQKDPLKVQIDISKRGESHSQPLKIDVRLLNESRSKIRIFGDLGWGGTGGLTFHVLDRTEQRVNMGQVDDHMPPPPKRDDASAAITLHPGIFVGTTREILLPKPGRYKVYVSYRGAFPSDYFRGISIWGSERPEAVSNAIWVEVN